MIRDWYANDRGMISKYIKAEYNRLRGKWNEVSTYEVSKIVRAVEYYSLSGKEISDRPADSIINFNSKYT